MADGLEYEVAANQSLAQVLWSHVEQTSHAHRRHYDNNQAAQTAPSDRNLSIQPPLILNQMTLRWKTLNATVSFIPSCNFTYSNSG